MLTFLPAYSYYIIAGVLGALMGSFANVCIVRIPGGKSVVSPRSHCVCCSHQLSWWENIPLISYILLLGRCRECKKRISIQYPIVEILSILLALMLWWHFRTIGRFLAYYFLLVLPLIIITFIDLRHKIIPDIFSIPGIFAGLAVRFIFAHPALRFHELLDSVIGVVVGGGFLFLVALGYEKLKKREGLGGGDVKFAAMLGAFFGWQSIIFILLASSLIGLVVGIFTIVVLRKGRYFEIPFGPFMAFAAMLFLFYGNNIISWYLNLF
ncbi:MAG: prepilin peptidase [Pseudomonadota bacterium]